MIPSFFGYYNAHRGIMAAQSAINVINNNITSADLEGYSRQRIELGAEAAWQYLSNGGTMNPGQYGQSVRVLDVTRAHNNFIDLQYRSENNNKFYYDTLSSAMRQMESIMGEPNGRTISDTIRDFFASAQELSANPDNIAVRQQFIQLAENLLFVFQQQGQQLRDLRTELVGDASVPATITTSQLAVEVSEVNEILDQVASLNKQIALITSTGASPNSLLDQRDVLLDRLSEKMNVDIVRNTNNTNTDIMLNGNILVRGDTVVNRMSVTANPGPVPTAVDRPTNINLTNGATVNTAITTGTIGGLLTMGGVAPGEATIRNVLLQLDDLFDEIATDLNALQATGRDLNGNIPVVPNNDIFGLVAGPDLALFRYSINSNIVNDPTLIAAASNVSGAFEGAGDGRNALLMAQLETSITNASLGNITYGDYIANTVSQLGVRSSATSGEYDTAKNIIFSINERKQAFSSVNIDEEMVNLVKFQRSLEASQRAFRSIDEAMQTIMGMVR